MVQTFFAVSLLLFVGAFFVDVESKIGKEGWTNKKYDEELAKTLSYLSGAAYADSPRNCMKRSLPSDYDLIVENKEYFCDSKGNGCAFYVLISKKDQEMIVVFRGTSTLSQLIEEGLQTSSISNVIINGWQSMKPTESFSKGAGKVDKYFSQALNYLWGHLTHVLSNTETKNYKITFTGHSLGGALASMAAIRCVLENFRTTDQVRLYTFGEPRQGDKAYAEMHDKTVPVSYRVVNHIDIVPHVPPCFQQKDRAFLERGGNKPCDENSTDTFRHHGTEIWYQNGMVNIPIIKKVNYKVCDGKPKDEDYSCSDAKVSFPIVPRHIQDHIHYFGHLLTLLGESGCISLSLFEKGKQRESINTADGQEAGPMFNEMTQKDQQRSILSWPRQPELGSNVQQQRQQQPQDGVQQRFDSMFDRRQMPQDRDSRLQQQQQLQNEQRLRGQNTYQGGQYGDYQGTGGNEAYGTSYGQKLDNYQSQDEIQEY